MSTGWILAIHEDTGERLVMPAARTQLSQSPHHERIRLLVDDVPYPVRSVRYAETWAEADGFLTGHTDAVDRQVLADAIAAQKKQQEIDHEANKP